MQQIKEHIYTLLGIEWYVLFGLVTLTFVGIWAYIKLLNRARKNTSRKFLPQLMVRLHHPLLLLIVLVICRIVLSNSTMVSEEFSEASNHAITIGFIAFGGWIALSAIAAMRVRMLKWYDISQADNFRARKIHTQVGLLYRLMAFLVILITIALILTTFDAVNNVGKSLLASAGVAGVIIGFAAQKTLGSIFAGIQIAITQPIRIEDAVVVEGEWGWVEEITLTYVVIRIWDKRRLIVPITYFTEKPFQNWTRQEAEIIGSVIIHTDYSVPVDEMRKELDRLLAQTPLWNGNVKLLQVVETTPREIQLRALMTGKDSPTTWDLRCFAREGLIKWLQENYPESLPRTRFDLDPKNEYKIFIKRD